MSTTRPSARIAPPLLAAALAACALGACADDPAPPPIDAAAHRAAWDRWKAGRDRSLRTPGRPLSYTGLTWLHPGANTVGADPGSDVVLAGRGVPRTLGTLVRDGARVRFEPAPDAARTGATVDSQPAATPAPLRTDADSGRPSRVLVGSAGFRVVQRVDSVGVRSWDAEHPALRAFGGVRHFALDPAWRLGARFVPLRTPRRVAVMTEYGVPEEHEVVGTVRATIGGERYGLVAFDGGRPGELYIVFADRTGGDESYGFRFLRAARDTVTDAVTLDFNFAYNPDCAFSRYTTCPLPPRENRIRAAIRAGERAYGDPDGARVNPGAVAARY
jgi:hypothetical protein